MTSHISAPPSSTENASPISKILATLNQLCLVAFKSKKKQALIFQMLNDTVKLMHYDRAVLWEFDRKRRPKLVGISGQADLNTKSKLVETWKKLVGSLSAPTQSQLLISESFAKHQKQWDSLQSSERPTHVQWMPIFAKDELVLGLWLERWGEKSWAEGEIEVLNFLMQAYGASWEKFTPRFTLKSLLGRRSFILSLLVLASLFLVHVPLRVVAPCEVVPRDPLLITAPLEGIIEEITVKPGQKVQAGDVLAQYDRRVPEQELKVAQKQVAVTRAELHRATSLSFDEAFALAEVATLRFKLQREQVKLDLAQYHVERLNILAPHDGVVMLDDPEQWRGKPVSVGERILTVSDPQETKVRIWIPEDDNVVLDAQKPAKIVLNVSPEESLYGQINYIANFSKLNEKGVASFIAEADWKIDDPSLKTGLKGTAILYGENVSLFYWIIRRPWSGIRNLLGM